MRSDRRQQLMWMIVRMRTLHLPSHRADAGEERENLLREAVGGGDDRDARALLTSFGVFGRTGARGAHEQALAVGQDQVRAVGAIGTVLRLIALDGDLGTRQQRVLREPSSNKRVRRTPFDHPPRYGAIGVLDVEMNPAVRVDPIHLDDGTLERDRLVRVELGGKRMMRAKRRHTDGHDCDGQYDS